MGYLSVDRLFGIEGEDASQAPKPIRRRHGINVPLLLISLATVALLSVGAFFLLRYQVRRTADFILSRANALERAGQYADAAICLQHYLVLNPDDGAAYARLATVSDKGLVDSRDFRECEQVVRLYLRAIGVAPAAESIGLRKRVCELLFEQERFTLAEAQSTAIVKAQPQNPTGWRLLALSIYGKLAQRSFVQVHDAANQEISLGHALERSLQLNPVDVKVASLLAKVYRQYPNLLSSEQKECVRLAAESRLAPADVRLARQLPEISRLGANQSSKVRSAALDLEQMERSERARMADQIFETMLAKASGNALVWTARFAYREKYNIPGGPEDLEKALELAPRDPRLLLVAGQRALQQTESVLGEKRAACLRAAHQYFQRILSRPNSAWHGFTADRQHREEQDAILRQAYLGLGQVEIARGNPRQAIEWFRDGSEGVGREDIRFRLYLSDALLLAGQHEEAAAEMQQATIQIKEKSPMFRPRSRFAIRRSSALVRGKLYLHEGKLIDAIREFKGIVLNQETNEAAGENTFQAYHLLGTAYARLEQWDLAGISFEQALKVRPHHADALQAAAIAWKKANQPQRVVDLYKEQVLEQNDPNIWLDLAEALLQVQQERAPSKRDWSAFDNAMARARQIDAPRDASQACRLLLVEVEHALARQADCLTLEPEGKILYAPRTAKGKMPWFFRESHLSFLKRLLPGLEVETTCHAILNAPPEKSVWKDERTIVQNLLRELCLVQLRKTTKRVPGEDPLKWRACLLFERLGSPHEADALLGVRKTTQPVSINTLILQVRLLVHRRKLDAARELLKAPSAAMASAEEKMLLEETGIRLELRDGSRQSLEKARELLSARHHERPLNTNVVWQLALLALRQHNPREAQEWTNTLRQIEKDDGVLSKHIELLQLMATIESKSRAEHAILGKAHILAGQIVKHRPYWPEGWILSARLASHESRWKEAAVAYQQAIQFGAIDPGVFRELDRCLLAKGTKHSWDEARELLDPHDYRDLGQRLWAMLLLQRRSDDLDPPRRILERLVARNAHDTDRFLLANVCLIESALHAEKKKRMLRLEQARTHYHFLAAKQKARPEHIMRYVDFLLRYQSREEAAKWLPALRAATRNAHDPDMPALLEYVKFLVDAGFEKQAGDELDALAAGRLDSEPSLLGRYIDLLVRVGKSEKAEHPLEVLRAAQPTSFTTIARQARWLHGLRRDPEVPALIDLFANRWITRQGDRPEHARLALRVAKLYADLGMNESAERWYGKLKQYDHAHYEPLARHLAHQGNWPRLMTLLGRMTTEDSSAQPATVLARCLTLNRPPLSVREAAEPLLEKTLAAHPENPGLLVAIAGLRQHQGKYTLGSRLYQRALRVNPNNVEALSQLAQSESHDTDSIPQAFVHINKALRIAGPRADLLASKGMVYFHAGRPGEGLDLLKVAATTIHPNPKHLFYYALALMELNALDQARNVWREIAADKLAATLNEEERQRLATLQQALRRP